MPPRKVISRRRRVWQGIVAIALTVACITWIANVLPGSLQPRKVPPGVSYEVPTEGADGKTGPTIINTVGGGPIPTESVANRDSESDFISLEELQKNRSGSVEDLVKEMNLVFEKGGILVEPAGKYHRLTNQESETTPTRNNSDAVGLTASMKLEKSDIVDADSQTRIIRKEARTFVGTATNEDQVFMEGVENPNEFFKDVEPGIQLRSIQEEPDNVLQRKEGSPKQVQEMLGSSYSVTGDVAHEAIGRQVAALEDLQMDGTAVAGVRVVFTRPEAEKDGEFYVDPRGNVFRKASRMSHDACQQLLLMEDARHIEDIDCSYQYNHPAHTSHRRSPPVPPATQQKALPASSLAKALRLPSVGAPLAAVAETAERRSEPGGGESTHSLPAMSS